MSVVAPISIFHAANNPAAMADRFITQLHQAWTEDAALLASHGFDFTFCLSVDLQASGSELRLAETTSTTGPTLADSFYLNLLTEPSMLLDEFLEDTGLVETPANDVPAAADAVGLSAHESTCAAHDGAGSPCSRAASSVHNGQA